LHVPAEVDVQGIRRRLKLSQNEFASRFGIAPGMLRDWEQGRKRPEGPARALLTVIARDPKAVTRAFGGSRASALKTKSAPDSKKMHA